MEIHFNFSEALKAFVGNGELEEWWPSASYAVACYTHDGEIFYYRAKNGNGKHAEDAVLKHFETLLAQKILDPPHIKLYISNSPCCKCSQKIIDFVKTAESKHNMNLRVEIIFSSFYLVRRPSNEQNPNYSGPLPLDSDHRHHVEGLKKLYNTPGVCLRTFNEPDWQDLLKALGRQKKEDDLLREEFEQLIGPVRTDAGATEISRGIRAVMTQRQAAQQTNMKLIQQMKRPAQFHLKRTFLPLYN